MSNTLYVNTEGFDESDFTIVLGDKEITLTRATDRFQLALNIIQHIQKQDGVTAFELQGMILPDKEPDFNKVDIKDALKSLYHAQYGTDETGLL